MLCLFHHLCLLGDVQILHCFSLRPCIILPISSLGFLCTYRLNAHLVAQLCLLTRPHFQIWKVIRTRVIIFLLSHFVVSVLVGLNFVFLSFVDIIYIDIIKESIKVFIPRIFNSLKLVAFWVEKSSLRDLKCHTGSISLVVSRTENISIIWPILWKNPTSKDCLTSTSTWSLKYFVPIIFVQVEDSYLRSLIKRLPIISAFFLVIKCKGKTLTRTHKVVTSQHTSLNAFFGLHSMRNTWDLLIFQGLRFHTLFQSLSNLKAKRKVFCLTLPLLVLPLWTRFVEQPWTPYY